jgi:hypothetical protein
MEATDLKKEIAVGQRYWVKPAFGTLKTTDDKLQIGTVVWVHPKQRYAVLEFDGVYGKPRECYQYDELTNPVSERRRR